MNYIGIQNITEKELNFGYDRHYRETALSLKKAKTESEKNEIKNVNIHYIEMVKAKKN